MIRRLAIFVLVPFALILLGARCTETYVRTQEGRFVRSGASNEQQTIAVTLRITKDAQTSTAYAVEGLAEPTVFGLLRAASNANGFAIDVDDSSDLGVFVKAIDGVGNTSDRFWQFSVNGGYGTVAADKTTLKDGDTVEWKYEADQFLNNTENVS